MSIEVERSFNCGAGTPASVREFVGEMLSLWGCKDSDETACLLASELATNAVVHAGTGITVRMSLMPPMLFLEVEDGSSTMPEPLNLTPDSERGRGLFLIQALSDKWGAERTSQGKIVWFQVRAGGTSASIRDGALHQPVSRQIAV
jgi:anti-sigma regulatory factor (Ser/Thr protein kinase)